MEEEMPAKKPYIIIGIVVHYNRFSEMFPLPAGTTVGELCAYIETKTIGMMRSVFPPHSDAYEELLKVQADDALLEASYLVQNANTPNLHEALKIFKKIPWLEEAWAEIHRSAAAVHKLRDVRCPRSSKELRQREAMIDL